MPRSADISVHSLVRALHQHGMRHAVIAPGSRNTPLTLALTAADSPVRTWLHYDERSAGYFALGMARELGEPVAVLCTSGTAAANFVPAAVEARLSRVPVVFLTADRPPELRDVGAPQTVDQVGLFGSHVKWAVDLPIADESAGESIAAYVAATAARAATLAVSDPAGPVHLNVPFREPLLDDETLSLPFGGPASSARERPAIAPQAPPTVAGAVIEQVAADLAGRRGLIMCGPESRGLPAEEIVALASALQWPVIADPLSGLRAGLHPLDLVIDTADTLVREPAFTEAARPEVTLQFGAAPTSKPLNQWMATLPGVQRIIVDPAAPGAAGWRNPDLHVDTVIAGDPAATALALARVLGGRTGVDASWVATWRTAAQAAREGLRAAIEGFDEPFEGRLALDLASAMPDGAVLVAGNSMPVRDLDSFFPIAARAIRLTGTRGASGIDGVTSTAAGAAAATGAPVVLFTGDLSFLHDLNGLWPVAQYDLNLTVVLANNDGGGIFHFLPQREQAAARFEAWWGTPHGLDLRPAVELHRGRHQPLAAGDVTSMIAEAMARPGLDVLELQTERDRNVDLHRIAWSQAAAAVREALAAVRA